MWFSMSLTRILKRTMRRSSGKEKMLKSHSRRVVLLLFLKQRSRQE